MLRILALSSQTIPIDISLPSTLDMFLLIYCEYIWIFIILILIVPLFPLQPAIVCHSWFDLLEYHVWLSLSLPTGDIHRFHGNFLGLVLIVVLHYDCFLP